MHRLAKCAAPITMLFIAVFGRPIHAQFARPDTGTAVYLVTAGSGSDVLSWFGHSALVVADGNLKLDFWYDYGIIDPKNNSLGDEIMGKIRASVIRRTNPQLRLKTLEAEDRNVVVQQLMLTRQQRDTIVRLLDEDISRLGTVGYLYSHNADNCTTRVRDVIDHATHGQFAKVTLAIPAHLTFREHGNQLIAAHNVPLDLLADWITGQVIDVPLSVWDESYLPEKLAESVAVVSLPEGQPLGVERYRFVARLKRGPTTVPDYRLSCFIAGVLAGGAALMLGIRARSPTGFQQRQAARLLGVCSGIVALAVGLLGILIAVGWGLTQYTMTWSNENILLANPLILALVPASLGYARRPQCATRFLYASWLICTICGVMLLLLKSSAAFYQRNWGEIALMVPVTAGFTAAFFVATSTRSGRNRSN